MRVVTGGVRNGGVTGGKGWSDKGGEALLVLDGLGSRGDVLLVLKVDFRPGDALSGGRGDKVELGHLGTVSSNMETILMSRLTTLMAVRLDKGLELEVTVQEAEVG